MNPYSRFRLISNTLTAALMAGGLCAVWPLGADMIAAATGGVAMAYWASVAGIAALVVIGSLVMTEAVMPALFQIGLLRRIVLGRAYAEGTWMHAERGPSGSERLTVLHIRPSGFGYDLSGYCLNQDSEVESNRMVEWSKLDGPVLHYAYRSLMPDGAGNQARGVSELMMEQRWGAPRAYSGFGHPAGDGRRFQIEGVKLTKWSERRRLRRLDQRGEIAGKYWDMFFGTLATAETEDTVFVPPAVRRPVIVETARGSFYERRNPDNAPAEDGPVIARRRSTDWRQEDATPTADRIRTRLMENAAELADEEEELLLEDEIEDDIDEAAEYEAEEAEFDEEEYEADAEESEDEEEDLDLEDEVYDAEEDEDAEDEIDAEADEELEDDAEEEAEADDEPPRIRQRYARR
ncbi:MAG: hypothetical protein RLO80_10195 [Hyphomonas sp.]